MIEYIDGLKQSVPSPRRDYTSLVGILQWNCLPINQKPNKKVRKISALEKAPQHTSRSMHTS